MIDRVRMYVSENWISGFGRARAHKSNFWYWKMQFQALWYIRSITKYWLILWCSSWNLDHKTLQWENGHFETLLVCLLRRCAMAALPAISNNLSIFSPVLAEHSMEWWACIFLATKRVFSEVIGSFKRTKYLY